MAVAPLITPVDHEGLPSSGPTDNATVTAVASATSSTQLFAASQVARGRLVYNDSTAVLYLKFGTAAATNSYTVQLPAGGYFEFPEPCYQGVVHGIWAAANGSAYCTETS